MCALYPTFILFSSIFFVLSFLCSVPIYFFSTFFICNFQFCCVLFFCYILEQANICKDVTILLYFILNPIIFYVYILFCCIFSVLLFCKAFSFTLFVWFPISCFILSCSIPFVFCLFVYSILFVWVSFVKFYCIVILLLFCGLFCSFFFPILFCFSVLLKSAPC